MATNNKKQSQEQKPLTYREKMAIARQRRVKNRKRAREIIITPGEI